MGSGLEMRCWRVSGEICHIPWYNSGMCAYRRSDDKSEAGPRRRNANRGALLACGIPSEVADSDRHWNYVLLHGNDYYGTGWDTSWITQAQARTLLDLLLPQFKSTECYDIFRYLKLRAESAPG